jgi:hypothetical protein
VKLPEPFKIEHFLTKAQSIAEQEEHLPAAFLFVDKKDSSSGKALFITIALNDIEKNNWVLAIRTTAEKHGAKHLIMITEGWMKMLPIDGKIPKGAVRDIPGRKDALIVTYEGPAHRASWIAEVKDANAKKDRGVQPFIELPGFADGNMVRILPIYDITKN